MATTSDKSPDDRADDRADGQAGTGADALTERHLDDALAHLGSPCDPPELCADMESALADLQPVRTRRRGSDFALIGGVCVLYGATMLLFMDLRPDLDNLPRGWFVVYALAWLVSFVAIAYLALVPREGHVLSNSRRAGMAAVVASFAFVLGGLLFDRQAPGHSTISDPSMDAVIDQGLGCLSVGSISALLPVLLGALLLRNRLPVGAQWAGAGLGAAGGSLGGLLLHLHCSVADAIHLGVVHGGVVTLGAILGAVLLPRTAG